MNKNVRETTSSTDTDERVTFSMLAYDCKCAVKRFEKVEPVVQFE